MTLDDLARLICETQNVDGFKCTCPVFGEPDWCNGNRAKAQARKVVEALRPRLELYLYTVHQDVTEKSAAAFADGFINEILASDLSAEASAKADGVVNAAGNQETSTYLSLLAHKAGVDASKRGWLGSCITRRRSCV